RHPFLPSAQSARNSLFQHLHQLRRIPNRRFANEQVDVFRHHHESPQSKIMPLANFAQYFKEAVTRLWRPKQRHSPEATASDEVQVAQTVAALKPAFHQVNPRTLCPKRKELIG